MPRRREAGQMPSRFRLQVPHAGEGRDATRRLRSSCRSSSTRSASTWRSKRCRSRTWLHDSQHRKLRCCPDGTNERAFARVDVLESFTRSESGRLHRGRQGPRSPSRRRRRMQVFARRSATCSRSSTTIRRPSSSPGRRSPGWSARSSWSPTRRGTRRHEQHSGSGGRPRPYQ